MITRDNVDQFYDRNSEPFSMKLDAVRALMR
jgi:hypothetical protein